MSQPARSFSFPPPPPPPKPASNTLGENFSESRQPYGNQRGGYSQTRGRGASRSRGYGGYNSSHHAPKRNFQSAFGQSQRGRPAAPVVPRFGGGLDKLLSTNNEAPSPVQTASQPTSKANLLGLTPAQNEESASEDDGDEEQKLSHSPNGEIYFEYKGRTSTLNTPAEIAAWIAERRKRYPTQAKREAAVKEAKEKREQAQAERKAKHEAAQNARQDVHQKQKPSRARKPINQSGKQNESSERQVKARLRAEKLRFKLEKARKGLEKAEAAAAGQVGRELGAEDDEQGSSLSDVSTSDDSDDTSSSGSYSSDSGDDSAPEEISSKIQAPARPEFVPKAERPCVYFSKTGKCKFGERCRYAHDGQKSKPPPKARNSEKAWKKGLYNIMVENEQEEERKNVVRAIIALGEAGLLKEPA